MEYAKLPFMLSSRAPSLFALMLVSVAALGCPRNVSVHISTSVLADAKPALARSKPGITLTTSAGEEVSLDRARVWSWVGDDTSRWSSGAWSLESLAASPNAKPHPFYPPRGGTWTFEVPDETALSKVGRITTFVGGGASALVFVVFFFTLVSIAGPESTIDAPSAFRTEGIVAIPPVSVATLGGLLWAAGNVRFRLKQPNLGEGIIRW
jgi:hypothetical protein